MPADKYKFISPGVFVHEIDNTGRPASPESIGPAIIGRSQKGPILKPISVSSYANFINIFGDPVPGSKGGDVARDGNYNAPTYAAYAAQAWLESNAPITYVRLGGQKHEQAAPGGSQAAGWETSGTCTFGSCPGGAFGLFVAPAPDQTFLSGTISGTIVAISANDYFEITDAAPPWGPTATTLRHISCSMDPRGSLTNAVQFTTGAFPGSDVLMADSIREAINLGSFLTATTGIGFPVIVNASTSGAPALWSGPTLLVNGSLPALTAFTGAIEGTGDLANNVTGTLSSSIPTGTVGTLAATWYVNAQGIDDRIFLSGTFAYDGKEGFGQANYIESVGDKEFHVSIATAATTAMVNTKFNFTPSSDNFIRKVFNTNPPLTNNQVVTVPLNYWLGESYEGTVQQLSSSTKHIGCILNLRNTSLFGNNFHKDYQDAETGMFFSQDIVEGAGGSAGAFGIGSGTYLPSAMTPLFKLVARNSGDWVARNLKITIKDLKRSSNVYNKYGSFTVALRKMSDTDNTVEFVEQFNNCNLNPNSENFIGRKIGDRFITWDNENNRYTEFGDYPNNSQYVRVHLTPLVNKGDTDPELLPFGVRGPLRFDSFQDLTASQIVSFVSGNFSYGGPSAPLHTFISGATNGSCSFDFPKLRLRISASEGDPVDPQDVYFGVDTTFNTSVFQPSVLDHLKIKPFGVSDFNASTTNSTITDYFFTLDDMCNTSPALTGTNVYVSGSRRGFKTDANQRVVSGSVFYTRGTGSWNRVLDAGATQFTTVFFGGFDGLNIRETEPFRNALLDNDTSPINNYAMNSLQVAIDSLREPEVVQFNLAAMPGIKNNVLNKKLVDMCELRADAMAVIDLKGDYTSEYESLLDAEARLPNVDQTILNVRNNLQINSSYGAAYFPWVQIKDSTNGQLVWAPPSVVALGVMSHGQKLSELWFSPAGFTRGALSRGDGGIAVTGVRKGLTSIERDQLYDANINPIARFPQEGVVIFGQKTLQVTPSALDRINVRRLMIFLKREISRFAATILFDQNVRTTWNRFRSVVEPFLSSVQARAGITAFKLKLDETTTTPDLIDRNILYAKVFVKPGRAIEFIALDFILTDSDGPFKD